YNKRKTTSKLKKRRERNTSSHVLIEVVNLIDEAHKSNIKIVQLFAIDIDRLDEQLVNDVEEVYEINLKVAESLSGTVTPQGFFAIIEKVHYEEKAYQQVL